MFVDLQFLAALLLGIQSLVPSPAGTKPPQAFGALLSPTFLADYDLLDQFEPWEMLTTRVPYDLAPRYGQQRYGIWHPGGPDLAADAVLLRRQLPAGELGDSWAALGFRANDIRLTHTHDLDLVLAKVTAKTVITNANALPQVPLRRSGWQAEDSLRFPLSGPLFVVGQVGANSGSVEWQQYKFVGKTGLGWKLPAWLGGEVQVRTGRSVTNYDSENEVLIPEQLRRFTELSARVPVADWLNLEYTGEAFATADPHARETRKHELRLAVPLPNSGQIHVGAKFRAEDLLVQNGWHERMRWFMGITWRR